MYDDRVAPIALTNVAWQQYLQVCSEILGRSPARGVDASPSKLSDLAKYAASLAEFKAGKAVDAKAQLRRPGPYFQHLFFSFMILSSNSVILEIAENTSLDTISAKADKQRLAIVSGNLGEWREAVLTCCSENAPKRLRALFNQVKALFEKLGFGDVWHDYRQKSSSDGTLIVEPKI